MVGDLEIRTTIPIFAQRDFTRQTSHERQNSVRGFLLCVRCAFDNFRLSRRLIISYLYCLSFNPDGIMLMYADSGHRRWRWQCGSRAIILSTWGAGGALTSTVSWRLPRGPSGEGNRLLTVTAFPLICGEGVGKFVDGPDGHNLAAQGGNDGRWAGRLCRPAERVPLPFYRAERVCLPDRLCLAGGHG